MADDIDRANEYVDKLREAALQAPRPEMPKGEPGECDWCGERNLRIVKGYCPPCRDELGFP